MSEDDSQIDRKLREIRTQSAPDEVRLDLVSEPSGRTSESTAAQDLGPEDLGPRNRGPLNSAPRTKFLRIYFGCCHVYTRLVPPPKVLSGEIDPWRVYCPRCAKVVELTTK